MIDKEFFRLWFRERCDPYKDKTLPTPPPDLIAELASRYIQLYEAITGNIFEPDLRPLEASHHGGNRTIERTTRTHPHHRLRRTRARHRRRARAQPAAA